MFVGLKGGVGRNYLSYFTKYFKKLLISEKFTLNRSKNDPISIQIVNSSIFPYSLYAYAYWCLMNDEILTIKEVAEYLKLAEKTAYKLAAAGKLPGFKVGGSWRFQKEDVQQWIKVQKTMNKG
jgi:excisionase family DNA binding protein